MGRFSAKQFSAPLSVQELYVLHLKFFENPLTTNDGLDYASTDP